MTEKPILTSREKPVSSTPSEDKPLRKTTMVMNGGSVQSQWEQKVWGRTRRLFRTPQMSTHELILETPGSFCSIHYHQYRENLFSILAGSVNVVVREDGKDILHHLIEGMTLSVPARVLHQFQVINSALLLEAYVPESGFSYDIDDCDIFRQHSGGSVGEPLVAGSLFLVSKIKAD